MRKLILTGLLTISYLLATSANAQFGYDYIEAGYKRVSIDNLEFVDDNFLLSIAGADDDGFVFGGSFSFAENYFAYADFDFAKLDNLRINEDIEAIFPNLTSDIELRTQALGIGYHTDGDKQFVVKAAFLRDELVSETVKQATLGYSIELGGRGLLNDRFEWEANLDYTDPDANAGPSGELGVNGALRYHFGDRFSADLSASATEDVMTYGLNLRINFSR